MPCPFRKPQHTNYRYNYFVLIGYTRPAKLHMYSRLPLIILSISGKTFVLNLTWSKILIINGVWLSFVVCWKTLEIGQRRPTFCEWDNNQGSVHKDSVGQMLGHSNRLRFKELYKTDTWSHRQGRFTGRKYTFVVQEIQRFSTYGRRNMVLTLLVYFLPENIYAHYPN